MAKERKPYNKSTGRDYKSDYAKFQGTEKAKKDRASRNKARREAEKDGRVSKGDGKSLDHSDSNPRNNSKKNLKVMSRSENAGKKEDSRLKGSKRKKK